MGLDIREPAIDVQRIGAPADRDQSRLASGA
jgi:hypothetical protein